MTKNITFTLPAEAVEGATEAILLGDFNNWNPEKAPKLERQSDGSFAAVAQLEAGKTYHYRFLLNNGTWVNDYHAQNYENAPGLYVDNCVITVPQSTKEENKKETKTANTKVVKAEASDEKSESPKAKAAKKTTSKTEAPKVKKAKAVNAKVVGEKTEKPVKTSKKSTPKETK